MSSKRTTSGRFAAACSRVLRKAQAISSAVVVPSVSPRSARDRPGGGLVRGQHVELLQHLDHGPVGDPLAIGETAAADDGRLDRAEELRGEPGLAHTGIAHHRHELAQPAGPNALPRLPDEGELAVAPDEAGPVPPLGRFAHGDEPVGGHRLGLALQNQRLDRFDLGHVADEYQGRLPDQHLARLRGLLEARRDVHRVARRQPLLRPRHHLARHDADASLQAELGQRVPHLERRPHRTQRVVLVQHRHAEDRHHGVADEFLDRAAVPFDDRLHPLEVAGEQRAEPFGIERLAECSRAREVAEENRHGLALLLRAWWRGGE